VLERNGVCTSICTSCACQMLSKSSHECRMLNVLSQISTETSRLIIHVAFISHMRMMTTAACSRQQAELPVMVMTQQASYNTLTTD
jgi:hypothetical protein